MVTLNETDNLFFSTFVYLDVKITPDLYNAYAKESLTVGMVIEALRNRTDEDVRKYLSKRFANDYELNLWLKFIDNENDTNMLCSKKFRDWKITNIKNYNPIDEGGDIDIPDDSRSGFVAYTFVPPDEDQLTEFDLVVVAIRGSEPFDRWYSFKTDWYETNLDLSYGLDTSSQYDNAYWYLLSAISTEYNAEAPLNQPKPKKAIVTGHSLGGYLALSAVLLEELGTRDEAPARVIRCDTFDSPGLDAFYIEKYKSKLETSELIVKEFQNELDVVARVNEKITEPIYIKSAYHNEIILNYHFPFYMKITGNEFEFTTEEEANRLLIKRLRLLPVDLFVNSFKDTFNIDNEITVTSTGFSLEAEGLSQSFTTEKDGQGRITKITDASGLRVNVKWDSTGNSSEVPVDIVWDSYEYGEDYEVAELLIAKVENEYADFPSGILSIKRYASNQLSDLLKLAETGWQKIGRVEFKGQPSMRAGTLSARMINPPAGFQVWSWLFGDDIEEIENRRIKKEAEVIKAADAIRVYAAGHYMSLNFARMSSEELNAFHSGIVDGIYNNILDTREFKLKDPDTDMMRISGRLIADLYMIYAYKQQKGLGRVENTWESSSVANFYVDFTVGLDLFNGGISSVHPYVLTVTGEFDAEASVPMYEQAVVKLHEDYKYMENMLLGYFENGIIENLAGAAKTTFGNSVLRLIQVININGNWTSVGASIPMGDTWIQEQYDANTAIFNGPNMSTGYIYGQGNEPHKNFQMGLGKIAQNGCGIVAVYNALYSLSGETARENPADIIKYVTEYGGTNFGAVAGTNPEVLTDYINGKGYDAEINYLVSHDELDWRISQADASIVVMYVGNGILHYVMVNYGVPDNPSELTIDKGFNIFNPYGFDLAAIFKNSFSNWLKEGLNDYSELALIAINMK